MRTFCTYVCRVYIDSVRHGTALSTAIILGITIPNYQEEAHLNNVPESNIEEPTRCNNNNLLISKISPKYFWLILEINKLLLLHLVGSSILLYLHWWCTVKHKSSLTYLSHFAINKWRYNDLENYINVRYLIKMKYGFVITDQSTKTATICSSMRLTSYRNARLFTYNLLYNVNIPLLML